MALIPEPTHLPTDEDLAAQADDLLARSEVKDGQNDQSVLDDPRAKSKYTFQVHYKTHTGRVYEGSFTVRIPTIRDRDQIALIEAKLRGGMPREAFSPLSRELHLIRAHLAVCLEDKPRWAVDWAELEDFQLLQAIYEEVVAHEAYFLGFGQG